MSELSTVNLPKFSIGLFIDILELLISKLDVLVITLEWEVNDILELMGYKKLNTMVNEFNRNKVEKSINKDLEVKVKDEPVLASNTE